MLPFRPHLLFALLLTLQTSTAAALVSARFLNSTSVPSSTPSLQLHLTLQQHTVSSSTVSTSTSLLSGTGPTSSSATSTASALDSTEFPSLGTAPAGRASPTFSTSEAYGARTSASLKHLSLGLGVHPSGRGSSSHNATRPTFRTSATRSSNTGRLSLLNKVTPAPSAQVPGASDLVSQINNLTAVFHLPKASSTTTSTTGDLVGLLAAIGEVASLSGANPASISGLTALPTATMSTSEEPTTTNALSILLSAVPSSVAASIESDFSSRTSELLGSSTLPATTASPTPILTSPLTHRSTPPTSHDRPPSTSSQPTTSSTDTPSTFMTVASASSSTTSTPSVTAAANSNGGSGQLKNASVAGIATGLAAGAVLVFLAGLYLFRRKQQGKPFFGAARNSSQRSSKRGSKRIFPESAWLYDPHRSPTGSPPPEEGALVSHSRDPSASSANLIPEPRDGAVEMPSAPNSPPMHAARSISPLLAPVVPGRSRSPHGRRRSGSGSASPSRRSGSSSPSGRRSRSSLGVSRTDLTRPMSAIYEETPRPSSDMRQGLLAPGNVNLQRHST